MGKSTINIINHPFLWHVSSLTCLLPRLLHVTIDIAGVWRPSPRRWPMPRGAWRMRRREAIPWDAWDDARDPYGTHMGSIILHLLAAMPHVFIFQWLSSNPSNLRANSCKKCAELLVSSLVATVVNSNNRLLIVFYVHCLWRSFQQKMASSNKKSSKWANEHELTIINSSFQNHIPSTL